MNLKDLYLHSNICAVLTQDINKGKLNHAYMLSLPDNKLAKQYAKFFAMHMYCEGANKPCGECAKCKKVMHDNMSDIKYFPKNGKLTIEESRQIVAESFVLPYEGKKKLFVIYNFELSTPQSQNALLKVLEEPSESNVFLLITESETGVLKTIQSRAKKIVEPRLKDETLRDVLKSQYEIVDESLLNKVISMANGNLTTALNIATSKRDSEMIEDVDKVIVSLNASSDVLKASVILSKYKDNLNQLIDVMLSAFLSVKIAVTTKNFSERWMGKENMLNSYTPPCITKIKEILVECKNRIKFNCSYVAVIDYLLFGILEAKFLCK